jgi:hypothetical protein
MADQTAIDMYERGEYSEDYRERSARICFSIASLMDCGGRWP